MKNFFALLVLCVLAAAQVSAPRLGLVRLAGGSVRALHGVAGSFTLGEPLLHGVDALEFDGRGGWARRGGTVFALGRDGEVLSEEAAGTEVASAHEIAFIDADELVLRRSGARLRLPFAIDRLERAGAEYLVLSGAEGSLLARVRDGSEALFALPEAAE
jgi:hypothetical protein